MNKILLCVPYCLIIILVSLILKDTTISLVTGVLCGFAYFGWILPHYNKRQGD